MNAGRLPTPARLRALTLDPPQTTDLGPVWVGIGAPAGAQDIPAPLGLRSPVPLTVRARHWEELRPGRYLVAGPRLLLIDSTRDPGGRRADMLLTCTELAGEPAIYTPAADGAEPYPVQVAIGRTLDVQGELNERAEIRAALQLAWIELRAAPRRGDTVTVQGRIYRITGLVEGADDGVVVQVQVR